MARLHFSTPLSVADSWTRAVAAMGEELDVTVSVAQFGLLATIPALQDAVLALGVQPTPDGSLVWLSLSTYGHHMPPAESVQQWNQRLQRALGSVQNPQELHGHV
jgi:hypothetical protein